MKRSELKRGNKPLRRTPLARSSKAPRRSPVSAATPEQRAKVVWVACIVCRQKPVDPAHLIDRSLAPSAGDDPRAVVPLCRRCHDDYDEGRLDLSPHLEPHYRTEIAFAVESVGLFGALRRITNTRWAPVERSAA